MILRIYRATVRVGRESEYVALLHERVVSAARGADGLVAFHIGRRLAGASPEFVLVTVWRDLPALQAFTGPDWHAPIFFDDEQKLIESFDVQHFEALSSDALTPRT